MDIGDHSILVVKSPISLAIKLNAQANPLVSSSARKLRATYVPEAGRTARRGPTCMLPAGMRQRAISLPRSSTVIGWLQPRRARSHRCHMQTQCRAPAPSNTHTREIGMQTHQRLPAASNGTERSYPGGQHFGDNDPHERRPADVPCKNETQQACGDNTLASCPLGAVTVTNRHHQQRRNLTESAWGGMGTMVMQCAVCCGRLQ